MTTPRAGVKGPDASWTTYWTTGSGERILIGDLTLTHLGNAIKLLERTAERKRQGTLFDRGKNVPTEVMYPIIRVLRAEHKWRLRLRLARTGEETPANDPVLPAAPTVPKKAAARRHRDLEFD